MLLNNQRFKSAYNYMMKRPKICLQAKKECLAMCQIASKTKGDIVEIGRYKGGSLVLMSISSPISKIYSIDISNKYNRIALNLCKKFAIPTSRYKIITDNSINIASQWKESVDLLFVDGDHNVDGVYNDLISWIPHIKIGGIVMVHDYFPLSHPKRKETGPHDALAKYMSKYSDLQIEQIVQKMCILRKCDHGD